MKNTIQVSVKFSFKGENFSPSTIIDLDALSLEAKELSDLHNVLAKQNGIDTYSYAFEVMEQSELCYSNATGLACDCLEDGYFDLQRYIQLRDDMNVHIQLGKIAKDTLDIEDISSEPAIKEALLQAFNLGKN